MEGTLEMRNLKPSVETEFGPGSRSLDVQQSSLLAFGRVKGVIDWETGNLIFHLGAQIKWPLRTYESPYYMKNHIAYSMKTNEDVYSPLTEFLEIL